MDYRVESLLTHYSQGRVGRDLSPSSGSFHSSGKEGTASALSRSLLAPGLCESKMTCGLGSLEPEPGQDGGMGWYGLQSHTSVGQKSGSALAGCVTVDRLLNSSEPGGSPL